MKTIQNKTFDFWEFMKEVTALIDEDGVLRDVLILNCHVENIPKGFHLWEYSEEKKFLGLVMYKTKARFFGFVSESVDVRHNVFNHEK